MPWSAIRPLRSALLGLGLIALGTAAALAAPAGSLLAGLKLPLPKPAARMAAANAIGQTSLNTQLAGTPDALLAKVRASLTAQGYRERQVNTVSGSWGFNLVMDPPADTTVDGTPSGKTAALVLQATALGPGQLNLNVRFEGL
jgi:hypothetical protein